MWLMLSVLLVLLATLWVWLVYMKSRIMAVQYQSKVLLSSSERQCYSTLQQAVSSQFVIFCKIRLRELQFPISRFDKINHWHAQRQLLTACCDFVLCHPQSFSVAMVIQLVDDKALTRRVEKQRRRFQGLCASLSLPVIYFSSQSPQDVAALRDLIALQLHNQVISQRLRLQAADQCQRDTVI